MIATLRRPPFLLLGVLVAWLVVWLIAEGEQTLTVAAADTTGVHDWLFDRIFDLRTLPDSNPFKVATQAIGSALEWVVVGLQDLFSVPAIPRPVPEIGYLGVIAIAMWVVWAVAGWWMSIVAGACFASFGVLGLWQDSMDTLILVGVAAAVIVAVGVPLGIWVARNRAVSAVVMPVLDVMQTVPAFAYLLPVAILFGIGVSGGLICMLLYAAPPVIRITAHALRNVPESAIEATDSMGQTGLQRLLKVQLPLAKRTIVVGVNQTVMAALSMATIAAFISAPGLGEPVVEALRAARVGDAFVPGLCIVIMAIMLDRVTSAASRHSERLRRRGTSLDAPSRVYGLAAGAVVVAIAVFLSRTFEWAASFPDDANVGDRLADEVQQAADWISTNWRDATVGIKDGFTEALLNPLQSVIANSPWWSTGVAILLVALILGGWRAGVATVICLGAIVGLDLWHDSMVTLTSVLVATVVVMLLALAVGVWMGRSASVDRVIRPVLDAAQTLPPFIYLIPALALFEATRFTAIVAGIAYAAPVAIKLVADGIRGVAATTVEAAESAGTSRWQMIRKVQLPMAKSSLIVAANQGLLYVLSMVVIGGLVGGGALGYEVVAGFSQMELGGKGLAAGFCIALLGILVDRIARYTAGEQREVGV